MKRFLFTSLLFIFCCSALHGHQNMRVNYAFLYKRDLSEKNFRTQMDMMLDFSMDGAVFYSEASYLRDSLAVLAFDEAGNIKDEEQVSKIRRLNNAAFKHTYHIDFSNMRYDVYNKLMHHVFLGENGVLEMPEWTISEESSVFNGYHVRKATGHYMGREWIVWFTEEIPVRAGPWLLWGCPGLIVKADDTDGLFDFYILGEEEVSSNRWSGLKDRYTDSQSLVQHLSMREEESIKCRIERDWDYKLQLMGGVSGTLRDRGGNVIKMENARKFTPLIPDSYWKRK